MLRKQSALIIWFSLFVFIIWGFFFIYKTSFIAIDGQRHFSLFDDAMISMRYAWNLSHGLGLVWNAGERVEGYSNLLMTLVMAFVTWVFNKENSVIVIQILGIPTVIISAIITREISRLIFIHNKNSELIATLSFLGVLFYYPLAYLSLFGMETGLTTIFILLGIKYFLKQQQQRENQFLYFSALSFGLAFITRNDAIIFSIPPFLFLYYEEIKNKNGIRPLLIASLIMSAFILGQTLFRLSYYGDILPNTYYLKVSKVPITVRINDGILYSVQFFKNSMFLLFLTFSSLFFIRKKRNITLLSLLVISIIYQIWTGGDFMSYWRFVLPSIPIAIAFASSTIVHIGTYIKNKSFYKDLMIFFTLIIATVLPYWQEIIFESKPGIYNQNNMNEAIVINELISEDGSIGVYAAGLIPYYTDRYAIDFLGKSDPYIAHLYPRLPKKIVWFETITLPGHNKYDLAYSIKTLQPDYIQRFYWGQVNIRNWAVKHYIRVEYQTDFGVRTAILKKDSPFIKPEKGTIIPWGDEK